MIDTAEKERYKRLLESFVSQNLKRSSNGLYCCPFCGSGTGNNKTGGLSINKADPVYWKCFSCDSRGDIYTLIGKLENIPNFPNQYERAKKIFGGSQITEQPIRDKQVKEKSPAATAEDFRSYYKDCHERVEETDYFLERGLRKSTIDYFNLGFDPNFNRGTGRPWRAVIIPTSNHSFVARNTDIKADSANRYRKVGKNDIYPTEVLTWNEPLFVVEGQLDALSILDVGSSAVSIGSIAGVNQFLQTLQSMEKKPPHILIALDHEQDADKEAKVKAAAKELSEGLRRMNLSFTCLEKPYGRYKDANEALMTDENYFIGKTYILANKPELAAKYEEGNGYEQQRIVNQVFHDRTIEKCRQEAADRAAQ